MRFGELVKMADQLLWYKYVVKNVARQHGKTATFMPKPLFMDNGSGMHTHLSLWKNGENLFAGAAMLASPTWRCMRLAASLNMLARSWESPTPPPTVTNASSLDTKHG